MSHEMMEFHRKDNRYLYCIENLARLQDRRIECKIIERADLKNVQEFDYFYNDFQKCISGIKQEMDEDDILLINISSGTPAMKSGLLVLVTLGEFDCKTIQVVTPMRKLNEHTHTGYDVETLWELNEDNEDNCENRCREVTCPSLSEIKQKEIIKRLVREYDYSAAYTAAKALSSGASSGLVEILEVAYKRVQLDYRNVDTVIKKYEMKGFPIRSGDSRKYYEYVLSLDVKRKRGDYADFIRGITPIIFDLFVMILEHECNIKIGEFTRTNGNRGLKWDSRKIINTKIESALNSNFNNNFDFGKDVYSSQLIHLINEFAKENIKLVETASALREIEEKIRNIAAHQIISITDETIKLLTGYTALDVIKLLHRAFNYTGINIKEENWKAYEIMNDFIIEKIECS